MHSYLTQCIGIILQGVGPSGLVAVTDIATVSGLIRLVISLECFIEITPDFLCPFMND